MINFFVSLITGIFLGDTYLKERAERQLKNGETQEICGGRLLLRRHHNRGAMLNLGEEHGKVVEILSLGLTLAAAFLFLLSLGTYGSNLLRTGLSLLLGGAFSNTYDRLRQQYVTDYVSFGVKWKPLGRLVFNVSDFCIIVGSLFTVLGIKEQERKLHKLRKQRQRRKHQQRTGTTRSSSAVSQVNKKFV